MAEIVNLRLARKRKVRAAKADAADSNRLNHGRAAAETKALGRKKALSERRLDAHRRDARSGSQDPAMKKRSVVLQGHHTSVSLEDEYWTELKRMAAAAEVSIGQLIGTIDRARGPENLSSALRIAVLADLRSRLAAAESFSAP